MTTKSPDSQQSVAQLLEQILAVSQQNLAVSQGILGAIQQSNVTLAALLVSSKNIEGLLGGGSGTSIPAMLKVLYEHVLTQKK